MNRMKRTFLPFCLMMVLLLTSCGSSESAETSSDLPETSSGANNEEIITNNPTTEPIVNPTLTPATTPIEATPGSQPETPSDTTRPEDPSDTTVPENPLDTTTPDEVDPNSGASENPEPTTDVDTPADTTVAPTGADTPTPEPTANASSSSKGTRDNTPTCYTPSAPGTVAYTTANSLLDISNASQGYVCASYYGTCPKVKFQITGPDGVTYTYNLTGGYEYFPLSAKSGTYTFGIYENVTGTAYSVNMVQTVDIAVSSQFGPFLYPNQYCMFNASSATVKKAAELAYSANNDLDVVTNVYNYVIQNISYDYAKAANITSGYVCNVDATLASGTGICLDYAAVMTCMLRSQGIPTRLEVGYAGNAYHAWISTYITDVGWVSGIIEFDGTSWSLMDPTFAANSSADELKSFIGNGSNYTLKYMY